MKIIAIDRKKEFVEIQNDSSQSVDMSGWMLSDSEKFKHPFPKYRHKFVFPKGTNVLPNKTIIIHTFSGKNTKTDLYQNRKASIWNNAEDVAILLDKNNNLVSRYPQQATRIINGYAFKAGTKSGISDASVAATLTANPNAPGKSTTTDNKGYYFLDNLVPAKYKVNVSKKGFVSESEIVDVTKNDVMQDFYLEQSSSEIKVVVEKIEIIPTQPEWNKTHKVKVTFKNESDDIYHFETTLYRRKSVSDDWSEVPGAQHYFDETIERDEIKDVTFTMPVKDWMDWEWFTKNTLGFATETELSRKILYKVWFKAVRQEDEPAFENGKEFETTVKVSQKKRDALNEYNKQLGIAEAATASAAALTLAGIAAAAGLITAAAAPFLFAAAAIAAYVAYQAKKAAESQYEVMKDP